MVLMIVVVWFIINLFVSTVSLTLLYGGLLRMIDFLDFYNSLPVRLRDNFSFDFWHWFHKSNWNWISYFISSSPFFYKVLESKALIQYDAYCATLVAQYGSFDDGWFDV